MFCRDQFLVEGLVDSWSDIDHVLLQVIDLNSLVFYHDKFYELLDKGDDKGAMDILVKLKTKNPEMYNTLLGAFAEGEEDGHPAVDR